MEENKLHYTSGSNPTDDFRTHKLDVESDLARLKAEQEHQLNMKKAELEHDFKKLGWIGRIFGSKELASKNITVFLCFILLIVLIVLSIIIYVNTQELESITTLWNLAIPVITLSLGYLFGKG